MPQFFPAPIEEFTPGIGSPRLGQQKVTEELAEKTHEERWCEKRHEKTMLSDIVLEISGRYSIVFIHVNNIYYIYTNDIIK